MPHLTFPRVPVEPLNTGKRPVWLLRWFCKATGGHVSYVVDRNAMRCWKCRFVEYFDWRDGWPPVPIPVSPRRPPPRSEDPGR